MEKLVPVLIALAIFGYKSYQNYMKEQEAALKRRRSQAPIPPPYRDAPPIYSDESKKMAVETATPYYAEKIKDSDEIQRFKKERAEHRLALSKKNQLSQSSQKEPAIMEDFDLKKAVIMSVILDRPYQ